MPTALVSAEIVVGLPILLALVALTATYARRRTIARSRLLVLCGWRADRNASWRLGLMRLGSTRLDWFTLLGLSTRPRHRWDRVRLQLEAPMESRRSDRIDLIPDAAPVRCTYGEGQFELALPQSAYTALRSWSEAAPPGSTANVA